MSESDLWEEFLRAFEDGNGAACKELIEVFDVESTLNDSNPGSYPEEYFKILVNTLTNEKLLRSKYIGEFCSIISSDRKRFSESQLDELLEKIKSTVVDVTDSHSRFVLFDLMPRFYEGDNFLGFLEQVLKISGVREKSLYAAALNTAVVKGLISKERAVAFLENRF